MNEISRGQAAKRIGRRLKRPVRRLNGTFQHLRLCYALVGREPSCVRRASFDQLIHWGIRVKQAVALGVANRADTRRKIGVIFDEE